MRLLRRDDLDAINEHIAQHNETSASVRTGSGCLAAFGFIGSTVGACCLPSPWDQYVGIAGLVFTVVMIFINKVSGFHISDPNDYK